MGIGEMNESRIGNRYVCLWVGVPMCVPVCVPVCVGGIIKVDVWYIGNDDDDGGGGSVSGDCSN